MDPLRFFKTFVTAILLVSFSAPSTLLAAKYKEEIPIHVQLNIDWTHKGRRTQTKGSFMVNVKGKATLVKKKKDFLKYQPSDMQAVCKYKHEETMMDPEDKCFGKVIHRIEGSGAVSFPAEYKGISEGQFTLSVHLGKLGRIAASRYTGQMDQESFHKDCKNCLDDNYEWMMVVPLKATFQQLCDQPYIKEGMVKAFLTVFKELTLEGMHGTYKWESKGKGHHTGPIHIVDFHSTHKLGPPAGEGAHYRVSWRFGEVEPVVQIWCEQDNITDQKSKDVLVGRKIKLEAIVRPQGMNLDKGRWVLDGDKEGLVISGWEANENSGLVIPFEDYDKKEITFCWVDGKFTGAPMKVKYTGKIDGKTVEGKTTINVFKPMIKKIKVKASKHVSVGYPLKPPCQLFLGKYPAKRTPGIIITSEIKMPVLPADKGVERPHLLQYVQRIKEDILRHFNQDFFRKANDEWRCDERYPYGGKELRAPYILEMNDTPGADLGQLTKELHLRDEFETYLMFIPSADPEDKECAWVPLNVVRWGWAGAIENVKFGTPKPPCDTNTYRFLYKVKPKPKKQNWSIHPVWLHNVNENKREKFYVDGEKKWKECVDEMKKKAGQ